jgi:hypothetical protein
MILSTPLSEWRDLDLPTLSFPGAVAARTGGELLREFFGTLRADFGILSPFRSHIRDSAAKRKSEEQTYLSGLCWRARRDSNS